MTAQLKIVYKKTEDLIPYARNSRTHDDAQVAQIAASIKEFGWTNPILLDGENGIIAGHGRVMAAQKLGESKVPTIELAHMTDIQKQAYIIADNKLALNAGWDEQILALELDDLKDAGYDLGLTGFSLDEIDALTPEELPDGLTDEDAVPEIPDEPITKLGDIYKLGNHRLMCGDSTSIDAVDKLINKQKADMVFTDPPYGVSYTGGAKKWDGIKNDSLQNENLVDFLNSVFNCAVISTKDSAPWYVWHASNTSADFYQALQQAGKKPSAQIIWVKNIMAGGFGDYRGKHEPCIYCSGGKNAWHGGRDQHTIWNVDRERNYQHPTQKPVALAEKALGNSSKSGDMIIDLFGGSGSTLIACEKQNRHARLMELDPKYCDVIVKRWEDFTGKKAELLS
jgi:DNA modification methylase